MDIYKDIFRTTKKVFWQIEVVKAKAVFLIFI